MSGHANQNLVSIRKKSLLSGVDSECKDLTKFAKDTDSHLFVGELENSLIKANGRHYSLQAFKPKTNYPVHASTKQKFHGWPTRELHSITPKVHGQNWRNNLAGKAITNIINMGGTERTVDHETCCWNRYQYQWDGKLSHSNGNTKSRHGRI